MDRRRFISSAGLTVIGTLATGSAIQGCGTKVNPVPIRNSNPQKALVLWYSQTGNTERMGRLIASVLESDGLTVESGDLRQADHSEIERYDILLVGVPVHYADIPKNVKGWLEGLPDLNGIAAGAWVTHGKPGFNDVNTCCRVLEMLAAKGAATVGMVTFTNMNTFPLFWTLGSEERILKARDLPDEESFDKARQFAGRFLDDVRSGRTNEPDKEFSLVDMSRPLNTAWWTKQAINRHCIAKDYCINCGVCEQICPVGAINLADYSIDTKSCIVCMGCVNNCPTEALEMEVFGSPIVGFKRFCEKNDVVFNDPPELAPRS